MIPSTPPVPIAVAFFQGSTGGTGALPYWLDVATSIAIIFIALVLLVAVLIMVAAALAARGLVKRLHGLVDRAHTGMEPLLRSAGTIADNATQISTSVRDNVAHISTTVREDVERISETLTASQKRLNHAAGLAEQRLGEFSALLEVVQEEAEDLFIDTASTLRGVREGAARLRQLGDVEDWEEEEEWDDEEEMDDDSRPERIRRR